MQERGDTPSAVGLEEQPLPCRLLGNHSSLFSALIADEVRSMSAVRVRSRRHVTSKAAVISHEGYVVGCTVADVSVGGARLLVADSAAIPSQFELQTKPSGSLLQCRTIWRDDGQVGIEFVNWT